MESINLYQGEQICTPRIKQEFMARISDHTESGDLTATFGKRGRLTLSSADIDLLAEVEEKAQNMLGFNPGR